MTVSAEQYRQLADCREWYARLYPASPCYQYQLEVLQAYEMACDEATSGAPDPLGIVINPQSRQSGKNTTSARWAVRKGCKYGYLAKAGRLGRIPYAKSIKTAPTYKPQVVVSKRRMEEEFESCPLTRGRWEKKDGYTFTIKGFHFSQTFLSAGPTASRVGETANLDLEIDETQRTSKEVFDRDLSPMRGSTNAPVFLQGTELDDQTLLAFMTDYAESLTAKDGRQRVFRVPWDRAAEENPEYGKFCQDECERLGGAESLVWQTEYCLVRVAPEDAFLSPAGYGSLQGDHPRLSERRQGKTYVGSVDFCGAREDGTEGVWDANRAKKRDMTVFTVGELEFRVRKAEDGTEDKTPAINVVDIACFPGRVPEDLLDEMSVYFFKRWHCAMVTGDRNGVGDGPCASMEARFGERFVGVHSTTESMDRMGHRLMSAILSGRFRLWREEQSALRITDEQGLSNELAEARKQFKHLRRRTRRNKITGATGKMWWGHPTQQVVHNGVIQPIHDDIPKACGLLVEAAYLAGLLARKAPSGVKREFVPWDDAAGWKG